MGTRINNVQVTGVIDGDTIKLRIDERDETVRLVSVDTEESRPGGTKPVTKIGIETTRMAKQYFASETGTFVAIDIEFDTDETPENCFKRHRDNYGRLLCYVHKERENYNLKLIREGWSPYFIKYGRSRIYHQEFTMAEAEAQAYNRNIWDPFANAGGPSRDYTRLVPWWSLRAHIVEGYRTRGIDGGALSVRLDYERILDAADAKERITVFCDLKDGINRWPGDGAIINAGSQYHQFNLWIPHALSDSMEPLIRLIERRYAGYGRGYVYVTGTAKKYRDIPEIEVIDLSQLNDFPKA